MYAARQSHARGSGRWRDTRYPIPAARISVPPVMLHQARHSCGRWLVRAQGRSITRIPSHVAHHHFLGLNADSYYVRRTFANLHPLLCVRLQRLGSFACSSLESPTNATPLAISPVAFSSSEEIGFPSRLTSFEQRDRLAHARAHALRSDSLNTNEHHPRGEGSECMQSPAGDTS